MLSLMSTTEVREHLLKLSKRVRAAKCWNRTAHQICLLPNLMQVMAEKETTTSTTAICRNAAQIPVEILAT
jgi:hypothetical protein